MNQYPDFAPEVIDELCSADLDGELEAACADFGIAVDDARAVIAQHATRRAALASAGAIVGEITADDRLDELERRRLSHVATARAVSHGAARDRRAGVVMTLGSIAAAALIAVVVIAVTRGGSGSSSSKSAARASGTTTAAVTPHATTRAIGEVKDGRDLARKLGVVPEAGRLAAGLDMAAPTTGSPHARSTSATNGTLYGESAQGAGTASGSVTLKRCLATLPDADHATGVHVVATALFHGAPVTVARGALGKNVALWAFNPSTCGIVLFYNGS